MASSLCASSNMVVLDMLSGENSSSPPDVSEYERELSLVYLEQKAKLSDYFLATSLIRERMGIGDDRFNASFL